MPYLAFQDAKGKKIELSGNNLEQFQKAIEKNGQVAYPELALAFVKAFFIRRDLQVKKQKAILAEDEDAADAADEELEPAEVEETRSKEAYLKACSGDGSASSSSATTVTAAPVAEDPYAYLKADASASNQNAAEEDFM